MSRFWAGRDQRWATCARYGLALGMTLAAVAVRGAFFPLLGERQPFIFSVMALLVCIFYLGLGPALLCVAVTLVAGTLYLLSPTHSLDMGMHNVFAVLSYAMVALSVVGLANRQRIAKERADASAQEVSRLNAELERRVEQRTQELQNANDELSGFTHSIAHDMRQYLRGINVASQTIIEDQYDQLDEEGKESLESLGRNSRQASMLVDGLLEFARLGKGEVETTAVDLSALSKEVVKQVSSNDKELTVLFSIEPGIIVSGDWRLLRVLIQNLFENSIKYRSKEGQPVIQLGTEMVNGEQAYFVRDNGIGFDMKFVDHIFLPFQRLHRYVEYPGTGIGLANVKRIVEKHGGRIWAQSSPGNGATFYFTLGVAETLQRAA